MKKADAGATKGVVKPKKKPKAREADTRPESGLLHLQQGLGNRALGELLDDKIQMQEGPEEEELQAQEEEEVQTKPIFPADKEQPAMGFPDVTKAPAPAGPVPVPFPNVGMAGGAKAAGQKVKLGGKMSALKASGSKSMGDEAGAGKGLVSGMNMGPAAFKMGSSKVKAEGMSGVGVKGPPSARVKKEEEVQILPKPDLQAQEEEEVQMQEGPEEEELQAQEEEEVQEQEEGPEEEEEEEAEVQPQEEEEVQMQAGGSNVSAQVMSAIDGRRGGGQELEGGVRQRAEQAFGHDFRDVRVHTDTEADGLAKGLSAKAFTTGKDVFFRGKDYDPHSPSGRELIGHELTHVVQQHQGLSEPAGRPGDRYEQEADQVGAVFSQEAAPVAGVQGKAEGPMVQAELQTQEEEEVQMQEGPEEEELQTQEEEEVQAQEEEEVQMQVQRQEEEEPEEEV